MPFPYPQTLPSAAHLDLQRKFAINEYGSSHTRRLATNDPACDADPRVIEYWNFDTRMRSLGWTPILKVVDNHPSIVWVIQLDGNPVKTLPAPHIGDRITYTGWELPRINNLLYCERPQIAATGKAYFTANACEKDDTDGLPFEWAETLVEYLKDPAAGHEWLTHKYHKGQLDHGAVSTLMRTISAPEFVIRACLLGEKRARPFPHGNVAAQIASKTLLTKALTIIAGQPKEVRRDNQILMLMRNMKKRNITYPTEELLQAYDPNGMKRALNGFVSWPAKFPPVIHNNTPDHLIEAICLYLRQNKPVKDDKMLFRLADHRDTHPAVLEVLAFHKNDMVREAVSQNPSTPVRYRALAATTLTG